MKYTHLGSTDLTVSRLCLGTWSYGGDWGDTDLEVGREVVRAARSHGVNFFDTARAYGFGIAEELLSRALNLHDSNERDQVVIATKGGVREAGDRRVRDSRARELKTGIEFSLKALRCEYVDLFMVHWPDPDVTMDSLGVTLQSLVDEGKTRFVGVSNFSEDQVKELGRYVRLAAVQPPLHLFRRDSLGLAEYCAGARIGVFSYSALAHGLLSGGFSAGAPSFPDRDWRARSSIFRGPVYETNQPIIRALADFGLHKGLSLPELAIAWVLAQGGVGSAIVGARSPEHISQLAPASEVDLTTSDLEEVQRLTQGYRAVGGTSPGHIW